METVVKRLVDALNGARGVPKNFAKVAGEADDLLYPCMGDEHVRGRALETLSGARVQLWRVRAATTGERLTIEEIWDAESSHYLEGNTYKGEVEHAAFAAEKLVAYELQGTDFDAEYLEVLDALWVGDDQNVYRLTYEQNQGASSYASDSGTFEHGDGYGVDSMFAAALSITGAPKSMKWTRSTLGTPSESEDSDDDE